jgi:large subunit ribosomal protein L19
LSLQFANIPAVIIFATRLKNHSLMEAIKYFHQQVTNKKKLPDFKAGDNITVHYKIVEGNKERIQSYKGEVVQRKGNGATQTFTVRKISNGIGVERVFPLYSPNIDSIEVNKRGKVRRARLFYLRELTGKRARIKEKKLNMEITVPEPEAPVASE